MRLHSEFREIIEKSGLTEGDDKRMILDMFIYSREFMNYLGN